MLWQCASNVKQKMMRPPDFVADFGAASAMVPKEKPVEEPKVAVVSLTTINLNITL
jgi:hypothetical protein